MGIGLVRGLAGLILAGFLTPLFASLPTTTNYSLQSYGFGSGGGSTSTANFSLEGITGELNGPPSSTSNFTTLPGFIQTEQANVPKITLTNPSSYYDKLHFLIDQQNNPTDALYALQVKVNDATCDFTTGTIRYVQTDDTLTSTLVVGDYQTYSAWGSGSGQNIIGLSPSTTYCIRAKATQGQYTESAYGPSSTAATVGQSITFCLYTGGSCGSGNSLSFGGIPTGAITTSGNIGTDLATNADNGGSVYIYSLNGGLKSTSTGYNITSATANLSVASEGFGAQITSVSQSGGGPLSKVSPYNGSTNNIGQVATTVSTLLNTSAPVVGGTATTQLQVKPGTLAPAKSDYHETLTLIAAGNF